ncbi:MAG: signal peptidase II [Myxococcota bacterium]
MTPKLRTLGIVICTVIPLDQLTKYWVATSVSPWEPISVIDGLFRITHSRNPGAAFGLAQNLPVWVFVGLTLVALWMILSFYRGLEADDHLQATSLGLILAGALGNLSDRLVRGEVVDFLQFDFGIFIFPDFNVADSAIVIGVGLLLLEALTQHTRAKVSDETDGA